MALTARVTMIAPVVAVMIKLPTAGFLMWYAVMFTGLLWVAGYALVVIAVAREMLWSQGSMRFGSRRIRATLWAWLTSIGVLVFGLTWVDSGGGPEYTNSTLTLLLGRPLNPSAAHEVSTAIAHVAAFAWIGGWVALLVEWVFGTAERSAARARSEPPTA